MTLIASIITFSKKKILEKKKCYPRPSTLDMAPSNLDPRQKDRLDFSDCLRMKIMKDVSLAYLVAEQNVTTVSRIQIMDLCF